MYVAVGVMKELKGRHQFCWRVLTSSVQCAGWFLTLSHVNAAVALVTHTHTHTLQVEPSKE